MILWKSKSTRLNLCICYFPVRATSHYQWSRVEESYSLSGLRNQRKKFGIALGGLGEKLYEGATERRKTLYLNIKPAQGWLMAEIHSWGENFKGHDENRSWKVLKGISAVDYHRDDILWIGLNPTQFLARIKIKTQ